MNAQEAAKVLAKAAAYDNRQATQAAAHAWAEALDQDMPLQDALRLVGEHYRDERAWVMPADINRRWRDLGRARLETATRMGLPNPPEELSGDAGAWAAWKRAQIRAVKAGCDQVQAEARAWRAIGRTPTTQRDLRLAGGPPRDIEAMPAAAAPPKHRQLAALAGEHPLGDTCTHPKV